MIIWWLVVGILVVCFGLVVFIGAPYVPSKKRDLAVAFDELYPLSERDLLVDIGSGDGVVLRQAALRGARAVGYEINPFLVVLARFLSRRQPRVSVQQANFWRTKLPPETTIVYTFGDSRDIKKMAAKVQADATRLNKSLYFVSLGFAIPGMPVLNQAGAYFLYKIDPLQPLEA